MNHTPHVWPPPPTLPEPQPQLKPAPGNERLGALSPLCVTLGLAIAFFSSFSSLIAFVYVGGLLVLAGFILGIFNWRTDGGKTGIALVIGLPSFILMLLALARFL